MGARLLHRTPERYILTPLGASVLEHAQRIETEFLAAERIISGHDCALKGKVRLTTVDIMAARIVVPALARLQQEHSGILVELVSDTRQLSLSRREADIAIRMTRFEGHEVITRRLGSFGMALYAARDYDIDAVPARLVTVMDDLAHLPEALWLHQHFPGADIALKTNNREAQLWAVRRGMGIACLICYRAEGEPELVRVRPDLPLLRRDIWMGVHQDMRHTPRIRAVMDAITDAVAEQSGELYPE